MEKINIAELLKDFPTGMELDCAMFEDVYFDNISDCGKFIYCYINHEDHKTSICFNKYGAYSNLDKSKCVIFPKGKTTWEGFVPPKPKFKCGDVVACDCSNDDIQLFIFKEYVDNNRTVCYLFLDTDGTLDIGEFVYEIDRLATEEEKQKLFDAIKANGYYWNPETKTLEKLPKFKVGDRVRNKNYKDYIYDIHNITDKGYRAKEIDADSPILILFGSQEDNYELVLDKFDVTTLKPFDKVLVRDNKTQEWSISFFSHCNGLTHYKYSCINGSGYAYCIPYENNEHLLGTTNDCSDFYNLWL